MATRPFAEALSLQRSRAKLPTNLGSSELRALDATLRRHSLFSARTTLEAYLDQIDRTVSSVLEPRTIVRDGREVTVGTDPATARLELKQKLAELGYQPDAKLRGTIMDLSSDARINLVVKTNVEMMQGFGNLVQGQTEGALDEFPAQELYRLEDRNEERDWGQTANGRWIAACRAAGDADAIDVWQRTGRMVATKDSRVWDELGNGAGGYENDALGNPYPPFAFNSGMWVEDVQRDEAIALGLITEDEQVQPRDLLQLAPNMEEAA